MRWADHARSLAAGRSVVEPAFALLPAMLGSEMVAAVYLAQPESASLGDTRVFGAAIAQAVRAADGSAPARRVPEAAAGRGDQAPAALPAGAERLEHRPRRPTPGRHAAHGLHAPAQLRNRAQARAEAVQEAAGTRMSGLELAVAHAVKLALVVLLFGMLWRGRVAAMLGVRRLRDRGPGREHARVAVAGALPDSLVLDLQAGDLRPAEAGDRARAAVSHPRGPSPARGEPPASWCWRC